MFMLMARPVLQTILVRRVVVQAHRKSAVTDQIIVAAPALRLPVWMAPVSTYLSATLVYTQATETDGVSHYSESVDAMRLLMMQSSRS